MEFTGQGQDDAYGTLHRAVWCFQIHHESHAMSDDSPVNEREIGRFNFQITNNPSNPLVQLLKRVKQQVKLELQRAGLNSVYTC